jgi:hypothetical protein
VALRRPELRRALAGLKRFIATVETAKHRVFQFLEPAILPDNMIVAIASEDAYHLGILSSRVHLTWTAAAGGTLEDRPRYTKSQCFDPFPFPAADRAQQATIQSLAEELDRHRKRQQDEHPSLTLTDMYNVLRKLGENEPLDSFSATDRRVFDDGLLLVLKDLHSKLDLAVLDAYGWPADISDEEILTRLVALNKDRAAEEARGKVRWLRPDYQIARFGTVKQGPEQLSAHLITAEAKAQKPTFPSDEVAQTAAVMSVLASNSGPVNASDVASRFRQGRRIESKIRSVLAALTRLGFISTTDGGMTFLLRKAS